MTLHDWPSEIDDLRRRVEVLEAHAREARPTLDDHQGRLDTHERQLTTLIEDLREARREMGALRGDVLRMASALTSQGLVLEKVHSLLEMLVRHHTPSVVVTR